MLGLGVGLVAVSVPDAGDPPRLEPVLARQGPHVPNPGILTESKPWWIFINPVSPNPNEIPTLTNYRTTPQALAANDRFGVWTVELPTSRASRLTGVPGRPFTTGRIKVQRTRRRSPIRKVAVIPF